MDYLPAAPEPDEPIIVRWYAHRPGLKIGTGQETNSGTARSFKAALDEATDWINEGLPWVVRPVLWRDPGSLGDDTAPRSYTGGRYRIELTPDHVIETTAEPVKKSLEKG